MSSLSIFFFWLLAAQVVIFTQGWELYHGTAGRMDGPVSEPLADITGEPAVSKREPEADDVNEAEAADGENEPWYNASEIIPELDDFLV